MLYLANHLQMELMIDFKLTCIWNYSTTFYRKFNN